MIDLKTLPATAGTYTLRIGSQFYIGSSVNLKDRAKSHRGSLRRGENYPALQAAYDALPDPTDISFEFTVHPEAEALGEEQLLLDRHFDDAGNLNSRRDATSRGRMSEEEKARLSEAMRNSEKARAWSTSEENTERLRANGKSEKNRDHLRALAEAQRGAPKTPEHREKIAAAMRGVPQSPEHNAKIAASMRVFTYSVTLESGAVEGHPSSRALARALGVSQKTVRDWLARENASPKMLSLGIAAITREPFDRSEEAA